MKQLLLDLYSSKWENLNTEIQKINDDDSLVVKPTHPLLINLEGNEYEKADIKVMIFGQETNDWEKVFEGNMNHILSVYNTFYNSGYSIKKYGGHFWNGFNRFKNLLQEKYPNKKIGLIWNNVIKIGCAGRDKNTPPQYIYEVERENFDVITKEIEILNPDIIIFFTGPNYDYVLRNIFGEHTKSILSKDYSARQLCKLGIAKNSYRTYHPNYLFRNSINNYLKVIVDDIVIP